MTVSTDLSGPKSAQSDAGGTRSVERAADILLSFVDGPAEQGVSTIARRLGLGKSTVHRLLQSLVSRGLLAYVPANQMYRLGGRTLQLGLRVQEELPIRQEARQFLAELREISGETATLYISVGQHHVAIDQVVTHLNPKRIPNLGEPALLHNAAVGKVLLAFRDDEFIDQYLKTVNLVRTTAQTITDPAVLRKELDLARRQGYAFSLEELRPGTNGLGLPLLNARGQLLGGINVAGPSNRWSEGEIREKLSECRAVADALNLRLRYMEPPTF